MKKFKIQKATLKHLNWIVQSQLDMAMESENLKLDPKTLQKGVLKVLKTPSIGCYYLVMDSTKPVGICLCLREWSDWRNRDVWWIHSVWVEKDYRRQGVFRFLYLHLKTLILKNSKLAGIRLYVDLRNRRAQKTYKSLGMNDDHYKVFEWMK